MEERKYFDYELAYQMYKKVENLFNNGGIKALEKEFKLEGDLEDNNGYITFYGEDYNTWVFLIDRNFNTDTTEKDWYVSGEVDIISYASNYDNLYITDKRKLEKRLKDLFIYAKNNHYSKNDYVMERKSIIETIKIIGGK